MTLSEKFEAYAREAGKRGQRLFGFEDLQRAFYAGAEAVMREDHEQRKVSRTIQAEIDHFRSKK